MLCITTPTGSFYANPDTILSYELEVTLGNDTSSVPLWTATIVITYQGRDIKPVRLYFTENTEEKAERAGAEQLSLLAEAWSDVMTSFGFGDGDVHLVPVSDTLLVHPRVINSVAAVSNPAQVEAGFIGGVLIGYMNGSTHFEQSVGPTRKSSLATHLSERVAAQLSGRVAYAYYCLQAKPTPHAYD